MDADLCRRAAAIKGTPFWRQTFYSDDLEEIATDSLTKEEKFIDNLTQFSIFEQLDPETQQFFLDCDRSEIIALEMGYQPGIYLDEDELAAIMERFYAS